MELDALGDAKTSGEPFERYPLGAFADDLIAQRGMSLPQHRQRAQHVGVALACDQVPHRDQPRGTVAPGRALGVGHRGPEVNDARLARTLGTGQLGNALAVGKHQAGGAQRARDRLGAAPATFRGVVQVPAVYGHDERRVERAQTGPHTAHRVAGRHGIVGVDEIERKRARAGAAGTAPARVPPTLPMSHRNAPEAARRRARR